MTKEWPFVLPDACPTCGSESVSRSIDRRYAVTESAEYKCGAALHTYRSHGRIDTRQPCPQSPGELAKAKRLAVIDRAVAVALNNVGATYAECKRFSRQMQSDEGAMDAGRGIWGLIDAKRPRDE